MSLEEQCRWCVVAASVTGSSHKKRLQPCQDAHGWEILPDGILVAAVADGAGSAALGELGAQIAATEAVDAIAKSLATLTPIDDTEWELFFIDALKETQKLLATEAAIRDVSLRDLASTLILVVAQRDLVAAIQVGDGVVVVGDREGKAIALTTPQYGEYLNETTFLISESAIETAQFQIWQGTPAHIAMLSDGLQMLALKMPDGTPYQPFFAPLFQFMSAQMNPKEAKKQLEAFLRSPKVTERTDDDLTLLLATLFQP